jgi:hypothetical protein
VGKVDSSKTVQTRENNLKLTSINQCGETNKLGKIMGYIVIYKCNSNGSKVKMRQIGTNENSINLSFRKASFL